MEPEPSDLPSLTVARQVYEIINRADGNGFSDEDYEDYREALEQYWSEEIVMDEEDYEEHVEDEYRSHAIVSGDIGDELDKAYEPFVTLAGFRAHRGVLLAGGIGEGICEQLEKAYEPVITVAGIGRVQRSALGGA